ncbi:MAG: ATP-dependent zinc protease [Flavobacteriaceae bacterium]|nr:MAG: ATP-dependent zinc protease [Flavobacteriaceae bacterium]
MEIIGRFDKAHLPLWNQKNVPIKIDTGAYSCSIDSSKVREIQTESGTKLSFVLFHPKHPLYTGEKIVLEKYKKKKVKNSFGIAQERFLVKTKIELFGKSFTGEFTLSNRSKMRFPILIGRKLLSGRFLVDTSKKNLSFSLDL